MYYAVIGRPLPRLQWYVNGLKVEGDTVTDSQRGLVTSSLDYGPLARSAVCVCPPIHFQDFSFSIWSLFGRKNLNFLPPPLICFISEFVQLLIDWLIDFNGIRWHEPWTWDFFYPIQNAFNIANLVCLIHSFFRNIFWHLLTHWDGGLGEENVDVFSLLGTCLDWSVSRIFPGTCLSRFFLLPTLFKYS